MHNKNNEVTIDNEKFDMITEAQDAFDTPSDNAEVDAVIQESQTVMLYLGNFTNDYGTSPVIRFGHDEPFAVLCLTSKEATYDFKSILIDLEDAIREQKLDEETDGDAYGLAFYMVGYNGPQQAIKEALSDQYNVDVF